MITITVKADQVARLAANCQNFHATLEASMDPAMRDMVGLLASAVTSNMHWRAPRPRLEPSIHEDSQQISAWHAVVGSAEPHARRRNYGFTGRTDRLGRYYRYDPGQFFMEKGMTASEPAIERRAVQAVEQALNHLGSF